MSRIQRTGLFAGMFFIVGMFSSNFISPARQSTTVVAVARPAVHDYEPVSATQTPALAAADSIEFPTDMPFLQMPSEVDDAVLVFAGFPEQYSVLEIPPAVELAISELADRDSVRVLIEHHFPELPEQMKSGWVDTYADMPLDELTDLLHQKKLMSSILPVRALYSDSANDSAGIGESTGVVDGNHIVIRSFGREPNQSQVTTRETILRNLKHASTAGYRRQHTVTTVADGLQDSADRPGSGGASFDMSPGRIQLSGNVLHLAITSDTMAMFRMEPGCVLTRNGLFERLDDGHIGIRLKDQNLRLSGVDAIPADATSITVIPDGTIQYMRNNESLTAGKIAVVRVTDAGILTTHNGVYFSIDADNCEAVFQPSADASLISGAFEDSNVDLDAEWRLFDHFERLSELP